MNDDLQNSEGLPAKQLQGNGNFSKEINTADVAELVDARDLKVLATSENSHISCKTYDLSPVNPGADPCHLQNNWRF